MNLRIGYGFDVHKFVSKKKFILGGIEIPYEKGCLAHSDGDVLIHAICDALLGAANLRDIGFHFPDNDVKFKNIDSKILLKRVASLLSNKGYSICNIDSTICLQRPKIKEFIPLMKQELRRILQISEDDVSIKATTTEKLGFVGRGEGISASVVVLIKKKS